MDATDARIVVVGAGQAGAALVARLRALGHRGPLTLIGAEASAPYQRPPLSKGYLKGELARERLLLRPASFYQGEDIELLTGVAVAAIDRAGRALDLADGRRLPWDLLALTTGAAPRRLPPAIGGDLDGVLQMRHLGDADALAGVIVPGARALVVGGGYIGLEAAAVLRDKRLDVVLIEAAPRILARVAAPATADYFRDLHRRPRRRHPRGDRPRPADRRRTGSARPRSPTAARFPPTSSSPASASSPRRARRRRRPRARQRHHAPTRSGRTSDPAIFAAGDCASFPWRGARVRLESVPNAIDHAEAVAAAMLGDARATRPARGSGRTSTTSSCRSPASTPAGTAP